MEMMDVCMFIYNSDKVKFLFNSFTTFNTTDPMPMGADTMDMGDGGVNKWAYFGCWWATFAIALAAEKLSSMAP